jgi:hypothetical protein
MHGSPARVADPRSLVLRQAADVVAGEARGVAGDQQAVAAVEAGAAEGDGAEVLPRGGEGERGGGPAVGREKFECTRVGGKL